MWAVVHEELREIALLAALVLGLSVVGVSLAIAAATLV